jgi:hypothetical protein
MKLPVTQPSELIRINTIIFGYVTFPLMLVYLQLLLHVVLLKFMNILKHGS